MGTEVPYRFRTTFSAPVPYKTTVFLTVQTLVTEVVTETHDDKLRPYFGQLIAQL